uniref:Uncharacterized protein n=1 Tax=viral metagenome TaxID=1070528 RepID=A0A6C0LIB9_9ZZZZ
MDELFFGVKRKKTRRSPARKTRRSPARKTRRSPARKTRRSPARKTRMCSKKLSLPKLRKLAVEHGVNIFSEAKTAVSRRTGMFKKPKMVGCSTLMKRLNESGLGHLYKVREVHVMPDEQLFTEEEMGPLPMMGPCGMEQVYRGGSCMSIADLEEVQCTGDDLMWNKSNKKCGRKSNDAPSRIPISVLMQADPSCSSTFQKLAEKQPNNRAQAKFLKEYKGYAMGQGPCEKRQLVPTHMHGDEDDLDDYAEVSGFDMSYGRRYTSGARPKKTQKHVTTIVVKGRTHHVFKGKEGGLYYLKGKTGSKVYIDKERIRKKK